MRYCSIILFAFILIIQSCDKSEATQPTVITTGDIPGEFIDDWTYKIHPFGNFDIGEFRLWLPNNADSLRAILVLCNHHNSDALGLANVEHWQQYAEREQLAIIGVHFKSFPDGRNYYSTASEGSGSALIKAIDTLASKHLHHELKYLPLLMRGYSAGGVFSHNFSEFMPDRVLAFANIRGGSVDFTKSTNNHIPGMMLLGEFDAETRNRQMKRIVNAKREEGGNWSYAIEPLSDHFGNLAPSDSLIKLMFSKALSKRVSSNGLMNNIEEKSGYLGNNETLEYYPFETYPYDKNNASWLIDEEFAIAWKNYQEN